MILTLGIFIWGWWVISTHPPHAIVSWDEGFHGGSALFISESLRDNFSFWKYTYILNDFITGVVRYPPLWLFVAGSLGAIFTPSIEVYRFATLIFAAFSIILIAIFTQSMGGMKAGIIAGISLSFTPLFIVYSHLMMREVPLLFSVSLTLLLYFRYLTKTTLSSLDILFTALAFVVGVLAKVIGIALIFATILSFGLVMRIFFKNSKAYRRFYSRWTIYFLLLSLSTFLLYRFIIVRIFHTDLLLMHLNQTQIETGTNNLFSAFFNAFLENPTFYLRDFSHMPALSIFWFGSLIGLIILRKSLISYYLLIWIIVSYLMFSIVKSQAVQYILSIFTPFSIATGLFWNEFIKQRTKMFQPFIFVTICLSIIFLGLFHLDKTEAIGWKKLVTNQDLAAGYVAKHAEVGDRVLSSGDGTRLLIRLAGVNKNLQTINGAAQICLESIQDSTEWVISEYGPQNPIRLQGIEPPIWSQMLSFPGDVEPIYIYKNTRATEKLVLIGDNLIKNPCARFLLLGEYQIIVFATPIIRTDVCPPDADLKINLQINPIKSANSLVVTQEQMKLQTGTEQRYELVFNQQRINQPIYFHFDVPDNIEFKVHRIEITNLENR